MKNQMVDVLPEDKTAAPMEINLEKMLHSIVDVICIIDDKGYFRFVSPSGKQLFGYQPEEMMGKSFLKFIHPEDVEKTVAIIRDRKPGCVTSHFANRYYRKDGTLADIIWSGRMDEEELLLYCVARDGSEKADIENRLKKAQQLARVANYEYDATTGLFSYTSEILFDILGLNSKDSSSFTTSVFFDRIHPDDVQRVKKQLRNDGHSFHSAMEYRIVRPDGAIVYISHQRERTRNSEGKFTRITGAVQDITDRKISELALKQSEERFRTLVQNGNDLIGIIDPEGNYTFVGENVKEHIGMGVEELVGKNAFEFIHPDDAPALANKLKEIKNNESVTLKPFRFIDANKEWRWMETTVLNQVENPAIRGLVVNTKDITEKKVKEDALKLSEQQFKALVQKGSDLIVILDKNGNFVYVSDNLVQILGYQPNEILGKNTFEFIHPEDHQKVSNEIANVLIDDKTANGVQHRFQHKNGKWIWLESKGSNHLDNNYIRGILVNSRNIHDRVLLQNRLNQELKNKQKEITSAVIKAQEAERSQLGLELHDNVNQILTTVKLYNELYLTGYMEDRSLLEKAARYTQDCINEIRSISKRLSAPTLGNISVKDSVSELVESINLTGRIAVQFIPEGMDHFRSSEDMHLAIYRIVQEGLSNIIKYSKATEVFIHLVKEETQIILTISDNGIGFDTHVKKTGIGITNMITRAENLNASFELKSSPGEGCSIHIAFPLDGN